MNSKTNDLVQVAIRIPKGSLRLAGKIADRSSKGSLATITRADVLRAALVKGLKTLDTESKR